jgi:hypothetical protein
MVWEKLTKPLNKARHQWQMSLTLFAVEESKECTLEQDMRCNNSNSIAALVLLTVNTEEKLLT